MLKAGSLLYAIFISIVIALISSALILFSFYSHIQIDRQLLQERLQLNSFSGINLVLSNSDGIVPETKNIIDLYDNMEDTVILEKKNWGAFELISSIAQSHGISYSKIAIFSKPEISNEPVSLYLCDQGTPLSLAGNTVIKGTCYLPVSGVRRAYIEGQNYVGNKLIDGNIKASQRTLPNFNKKLINRINHLGEGNDSLVSTLEFFQSDSILNSFAQKTIFIYSKEEIILPCHYLSGNFKINSDKVIIIQPNTKLEDVILFAPKIIIEKNVHGNFQAFATDSLIIKEGCDLTYPSVLGIIKSVDHGISTIQVGENTEIWGSIFAWQMSGMKEQNLIININKNALVNGFVYSDGLVDLKGRIFGSLFCKKVVLNTGVSYYENHLLNAEIDNSKLSKHFIGINILDNMSENEVIKWLN